VNDYPNALLERAVDEHVHEIRAAARERAADRRADLGSVLDTLVTETPS